MTRAEAIAAIERHVAALEGDLGHCQTRIDHIRLSQRIAEAREIAENLRADAVA